MHTNEFLFIILIFMTFSCSERKERKEFYPTGELQNRYILSQYDGVDTVLEYYKSGELKLIKTEITESGEFYNHGLCEVYDKEGRLQWILFYVDGKEIGRNERYDDNDKLYVEILDSAQKELFASFTKHGKLIYAATPDTNVGQDGRPILKEYVDSLYLDASSKVNVEWDEGHQLGDKVIDTTWRKKYKLEM